MVCVGPVAFEVPVSLWSDGITTTTAQGAGSLPEAQGEAGDCQAGPALSQVAFIAAVMQSGVEFVAVDNPHANKLTSTSGRRWLSINGK